MERLIKTIEGTDCEIYAIRHHNRELIGEAVPVVEVYEKTIELPMLGKGVRKKNYYFSVVLCISDELKDEAAEGLMCFELSMYLPRIKDGVFVKLDLCAVSVGEIEPGRWQFTVDDYETVKKLLNEYGSDNVHRVGVGF